MWVNDKIHLLGAGSLANVFRGESYVDWRTKGNLLESAVDGCKYGLAHFVVALAD